MNKYNPLERWFASVQDGGWDEWFISGPTKRIVLSHAIERLKTDGFITLVDTKNNYVWRIQCVDGKFSVCEAI